MKKKEFKTESKKLLDLMVNSIYTNKDIFLRELISNASDAIDKLYYRSLTDNNINVSRDDFNIRIDIDKENRMIIISDNGCGMTEDELENNLGTIAKSGSLAFKQENDKASDIDIIGQFGVGFYSSFMISKKVEVISKSFDSKQAYLWSSTGEDGYTIKEIEKDCYGTIIKLYLKDDTDDDKYSEYLEEYKLKGIIKKYSDYIRYPIIMRCEHEKLKEGSNDEYETTVEDETVNSMVSLWKKNKKDITDEEYNGFYTDKFYDYDKPLKVIHTSVEGLTTYNAMLFIPSHPPFDYFQKEYEKGLELYSNDVLIMDKCDKLLPDYLNFVKGIVDSPDLSLNISREVLQQDRKLQVIAKNIEGKVIKELESMLNDDKETYKKFFDSFGLQLKYGIYENFGVNKDKLKDLILFYSYKEKDFITIKDYVSKMPDKQEAIYYACGETIDKIDMLPQVELVKDKKFDILYLTEYIDEFVIKTLMDYEGKKFINVCSEELRFDSKDAKKKLDKMNEDNKEMLSLVKDSIGSDVASVRFTNRLKKHAVCLTTEGDISVEMEKVMNKMPNNPNIKAKTILEINDKHPIVDKLKQIYKNDKDEFKKYSKIIYSQAKLIEGLTVDNPTEISNLVCELLAK